MCIHDIDRPDIDGNAPKMQTVCDFMKARLWNACFFMGIETDDNICSSVTIRGTINNPNDWPNGIFQNGKYFIFTIQPEKGKRYYDVTDEKVTVELVSAHYTLGDFRKYTGTVAKVADKVRSWVTAQGCGYCARCGNPLPTKQLENGSVFLRVEDIQESEGRLVHRDCRNGKYC